MSDVDAIVEIRGHVLLMEWKAPGAREVTAQTILAKEFTRNGDGRQVYVDVRGDAESMTVEKIRVFRDGKVVEDWHESSLENLRDRLKAWSSMAYKRRLFGGAP